MYTRRPIFQASPESLHGYDIVIITADAAIGSRRIMTPGWRRLQAHGMGQVLDFVPNHVGIANDCNAWWMDVLGKTGTAHSMPPILIIECSR